MDGSCASVRRETVSYAAAGASVFIDRYLGVLFLVLLSTGLLWLPSMSGGAWQLPRLVLTALALALIGGGIAAVVTPHGRLAGRLSGRAGIVGRAAAHASEFAAYVRLTLRHRLLLLSAATAFDFLG